MAPRIIPVARPGGGYNPAVTAPPKSSHPPDAQSILFGRDGRERVVAAEPLPDGSLLLYRRMGERAIAERVDARPWLLLGGDPPANTPEADLSRLAGGELNVLAQFQALGAYFDARAALRDERAAHLAYGGATRMALVRAGITLFKGMAFEDLHRLQFDLETEGLDPAPENARILLIALADTRGLLETLEGDEPDILRRFVQVVQDRDPDVLEGHNLFGFDLPYLMERARRHGIELRIGRDGSQPRLGVARNYAIAAGANSRRFVPAAVHGRHLVDTYLVVQRFDWARQSLSGYGLKECARVFGLCDADRVDLPGADIGRLYREDAELVRRYALQDVVETQRLADLVCPVEFYQAQMAPDSYGDVATMGNGEKIDLLLVRAYLAAGQGIALQKPSRPFEGGYTEVRIQGLVERIVKADVESLYPSLMLTHGIAPASDTLGVFLPALAELTARRIEAKRRAARASDAGDEREYRYWDGLQGSFKVLVNSFYGYLGGPFHFNDYDAARRVTEYGRALVQRVADRLEETGSGVVEIDTDGVYFVPPPGVEGEDAERAYVAEIGVVLPAGIRLAFDGRFRAMLSVKAKNYVLLGYDGRRIYHGASLRSRAEERFGRRFLAEAIDAIFAGEYDQLADLYRRAAHALIERRIPPEDLARRERVTAKTFESAQKRRAAAVAGGRAVGEHILVYERMDGSLGLLDEYALDENLDYYLDKLNKFARRLEPVLPKALRFEDVFPRATRHGLPKELQPTLDLF